MTLDSFVFLGLYSYLRQLELSLDRVLSEGSTTSLINYFKSNKYAPALVVEYFTKLAKHNEDFLFTDSSSRNLALKSFFIKKYHLSLNDILKIIALINDYDKMISNEEFDINILLELRMRINHINRLFLESKISKKDKNNLNNVEHYNQSEYLKLLDIDELLGGKWIY